MFERRSRWVVIAVLGTFFAMLGLVQVVMGAGDAGAWGILSGGLLAIIFALALGRQSSDS